VEDRYSHTHYELANQFMKLIGANVRIKDPSGNLAFFAHQKGFKLKEDFRIYSDESKSQELFRIAARSIMDFSAAYDVFDSTTNQKIGGFKRRGLRSTFVNDSWIMFDANDVEIGSLEENAGVMAILRRWVDFVSLFSPQAYTMRLQGQPVGFFQQNRNPFFYKLALHFPPSPLDKRLGIAAAVLVTTIEGKQRG
jgi:hypothetical protein